MRTLDAALVLSPELDNESPKFGDAIEVPTMAVITVWVTFVRSCNLQLQHCRDRHAR